MKSLDAVLEQYRGLTPEAREIHYFGPFLLYTIPKATGGFDPMADTAHGLDVHPSLGTGTVSPFVIDLLAKNQWSIGRWDGDIAMPHPSISRLHARILRTDDGNFALVDEASSNHTILDGEPVTTRVPLPLTDGAKILFGAVRCTFYSGDTFRKILDSAIKKKST